MSHEPLGFLSDTFRASQQRWAAVDKEGFAIVSTFRRVEYLLYGGDHRNLAYIFEPDACVSSVPKTTAQRLDNWKMVLVQYDYTIMHISGEHSCRGDLLSRWIDIPAVALRAVAAFASSAPDDAMPSKDAVLEVEQQTRSAWLAALLRSLLRLVAR